MKKHLFTIICLCASLFAAHPQNARNGYEVSPNGMLRILVVFADVVDDPDSSSVPGWNAGQLPRYKDSIIDPSISTSIVSQITHIFHQASFGAFQVVGDYLPYLVPIHYSDVSNSSYFGYGAKKVVDYLNSVSGEIYTNGGLPLSDFDKWTPSGDSYNPKTQEPDSRIDMLTVVWRNNSKFRKKRDGGKAYPGRNWPLKNMVGLNSFMIICTDGVSGCMRHELAHKLLGDNDYHTGGAGAGVGHFLSNIGGYGILSSFNKNLYSCNAWDRWRLGWKSIANQYYISARRPDDMTEVETDLEYGEALTDEVFVLRDFLTYGDAIRIKLPYVKSIRPHAENQYLWIENHQMLPGSPEYDPNKPKGVRFNIQIGNDVLVGAELNHSRTNYYDPLSSFGNYDFDYYFDPANAGPGRKKNGNYTASTSWKMANPFSGHHLLMLPALDTLPGDDVIGPKEYVAIYNVLYDGVQILDHHPVFGSQYDVFPTGSSLRLSTNPSSVPLLTYKTGARSINNDIYNQADTHDNRHIFLNGLRVDVLEEDVDGNGAVKVRIRWNDFDVDRHVRWCDSIILTEMVVLNSGYSITLDQGRSPVQPCNPLLFNQQKIFADPTVFTCRDGSTFTQKGNSVVNVINNSTLTIESGATYIVEDNASLNLLSNSTLIVEDGATLKVIGRGHVEIDSSAYLCLGEYANLILLDELSALNFHHGAVLGVDTTVHPEATCSSIDFDSINFTGNGHFINYNNSCYIQNRTFNTQTYLTGSTVCAGHHVTNDSPYGDVIISPSADVIIDADADTFLESGVEVSLGGQLEVR